MSQTCDILAEGSKCRRPKLHVGFHGMHYRIFYFFHGNVAAVLSHGLTTERAVPPREIGLAIKRRAKFLAHPTKHIFEDRQSYAKADQA